MNGHTIIDYYRDIVMTDQACVVISALSKRTNSQKQIN